MNKEQIILRLEETHKQFTAYIDTLTETQFVYAKPEKWTAGQQLKHLHTSVKALTQGLRLPKFVLNMIFGKPNRTSRDYEALVKRYTDKLSQGGRASGRFVPTEVVFASKQKLITYLQQEVSKLTHQVNKMQEKDLDTILLPHPLLGKVTLREMLYFTIYHVQHHEKLIKESLM